jgi:hypothetical protein
MPRLMSASGLVSVLLTAAALAGAQVPGVGKPAWPDVFVSPGMYSERYEKPVVGKGDKPDTYQQKAIYNWSGGRFEILEITLARDPAFKDKYSAEALRKEKNPPKELEISNKKAWQWDFPRDPAKAGDLAHRLVIVLEPDKVIIIDQKGGGANLEYVAKLFNFENVAKALANPPK